MRVRFLFLALLLTAGACGENPSAPPAPPPPPTLLANPGTLANLSATTSSPVAGTSIGCRQDVRGRVTLTNAAPSPVSVSRLRKVTTVVSGDCLSSEDRDYRVSSLFVDPQTTAVIFDQPLYRVGAGCCPDPERCSGATCEIREEMSVLTSLGTVPAGSFTYRVTFQGCEACADGAANCAPVRVTDP